ncbi:hypothetical protein C5167_015877 [Papaver somniferum]|nr:hypothetical protein C5167_015877 [Papaver somniferum]
MCIAVFIWLAHPLYPFFLLLNRDEYHDRPTEPVSWWGDGDILGGRDEVAGGTWLACTRGGKVAFITNVLESLTLPDAKSRGELPVRFLKSTKSPREFAEEVLKEADQYNGPKGEANSLQEVSSGVHVLSNAKLDSPWPKARSLRQNFNKLLRQYGEKELPVKDMVEELMEDTAKADKSRLPKICAPDWEYKLSSIFVETDTPLGCYGTRSTAALTVKTSGEVSFYEKYIENETWKEHTVSYQIE